VLSEAHPIPGDLVGDLIERCGYCSRVAPGYVVGKRFAVELAPALSELASELVSAPEQIIRDRNSRLYTESITPSRRRPAAW
jgi:hypothetical protein